MKVDLAITTYVDDLHRLYIHPKEPESECAPIIQQLNSQMHDQTDAPNARLHEGGVVQNLTKLVLVPHMIGVGSDLIHKLLFSGAHSLEGKVVRAARNLGPYLHATQSLVCERERRVLVIKAGWLSMGTCWTTPAPLSVKRMIFIGRVQGAAFSAQSSMLVSEPDCCLYDRFLMNYIRVLRRGEATHKITTTNDRVETKSVYKKRCGL